MEPGEELIQAFTLTTTAEGYWFFGLYTDAERAISVDWGDGSAVEYFTTALEGSDWYKAPEHTYAGAGSKNVVVSAVDPAYLIAFVSAGSNNITVIDLSLCTSVYYVDLLHNALSTFDPTGLPLLSYLNLHGNSLSSGAVDAVAVAVAAAAVDNGMLLLVTNSVPGASGLAAVATLRARGWTVSIDGEE